MKKLVFLGVMLLCAGFTLFAAGGAEGGSSGQSDSRSSAQNRETDPNIAGYTKALESNPNDAEAYFNRGFAYEARGDIDKALADYTSAVNIKPDFSEAYYNRGNIHYSKGRYNEAIEDFSKANEQDPSNQDYQEALQAAESAKAGG